MNDPRQPQGRRGTRGGRWGGRNSRYQGRGGRDSYYQGRGGRGGEVSKWDKKPQNPSRFIGASSKMLGYVFQANGEQFKRGQFKDTLDMLKIYASENYTKDVRKMESLFGDDIRTPVIQEPEEPKIRKGNTAITKSQEKIYDAKIAAFVKEEKSMEDSLTALYNITWGQCSAMMQNRLESLLDYKIINKYADVATLLKEIRNISNELQVSANVYNALDEAKGKYYRYYQDHAESNIKHVKNIKELVATIEHYGGDICNDSGLIKHEKRADGNITTSKNYEALVRGKVLGCAVIKRSNTQIYGDLLKN